MSAAFVDVIWFADDEEECHRVLLYVNLEKRLQVLHGPPGLQADRLRILSPETGVGATNWTCTAVDPPYPTSIQEIVEVCMRRNGRSRPKHCADGNEPVRCL